MTRTPIHTRPDGSIDTARSTSRLPALALAAVSVLAALLILPMAT